MCWLAFTRSLPIYEVLYKGSGIRQQQNGIRDMTSMQDMCGELYVVSIIAVCENSGCAVIGSRSSMYDTQGVIAWLHVQR